MAEGGTQGIQQKNVDNSTENCINESKRQRKWECQEWHVADETGMIQKRREKKAHNQKPIQRGPDKNSVRRV